MVSTVILPQKKALSMTSPRTESPRRPMSNRAARIVSVAVNRGQPWSTAVPSAPSRLSNLRFSFYLISPHSYSTMVTNDLPNIKGRTYPYHQLFIFGLFSGSKGTPQTSVGHN